MAIITQDWLTVTPTSGEVGTTSVSLSAQTAGVDRLYREAKITFRAGNLTKEVYVTQHSGAGDGYQHYNAPAISIAQTGRNATITLTLPENNPEGTVYYYKTGASENAYDYQESPAGWTALAATTTLTENFQTTGVTRCVTTVAVLEGEVLDTKFKTWTPSLLPVSVPQNLRCTQQTSSSLRFEWDAPTTTVPQGYSMNYAVYYAPETSNGGIPTQATATLYRDNYVNTYAEITSLAAGKKYYVFVSAKIVPNYTGQENYKKSEFVSAYGTTKPKPYIQITTNVQDGEVEHNTTFTVTFEKKNLEAWNNNSFELSLSISDTSSISIESGATLQNGKLIVSDTSLNTFSVVIRNVAITPKAISFGAVVTGGDSTTYGPITLIGQFNNTVISAQISRNGYTSETVTNGTIEYRTIGNGNENLNIHVNVQNLGSNDSIEIIYSSSILSITWDGTQGTANRIVGGGNFTGTLYIGTNANTTQMNETIEFKLNNTTKLGDIKVNIAGTMGRTFDVTPERVFTYGPISSLNNINNFPWMHEWSERIILTLNPSYKQWKCEASNVYLVDESDETQRYYTNQNVYSSDSEQIYLKAKMFDYSGTSTIIPALSEVITFTSSTTSKSIVLEQIASYIYNGNTLLPTIMIGKDELDEGGDIHQKYVANNESSFTVCVSANTYYSLTIRVPNNAQQFCYFDSSFTQSSLGTSTPFEPGLTTGITIYNKTDVLPTRNDLYNYITVQKYANGKVNNEVNLVDYSSNNSQGVVHVSEFSAIKQYNNQNAELYVGRSSNQPSFNFENMKELVEGVGSSDINVFFAPSQTSQQTSTYLYSVYATDSWSVTVPQQENKISLVVYNTDGWNSGEHDFNLNEVNTISSNGRIYRIEGTAGYSCFQIQVKGDNTTYVSGNATFTLNGVTLAQNTIDITIRGTNSTGGNAGIPSYSVIITNFEIGTGSTVNVTVSPLVYESLNP